MLCLLPDAPRAAVATGADPKAKVFFYDLKKNRDAGVAWVKTLSEMQPPPPSGIKVKSLQSFQSLHTTMLATVGSQLAAMF